MSPCYCIVFEDPDRPDDPVQVMHAAKRWLENVMAQGYSEEEAMELLAAKDLPDSVKEYAGNRRIMAIVPLSAIPTDRTFRNAWEMAA